MTDSICKEMEIRKKEFSGNYNSLYFGGGTTTKGDIVYMTTAGAWASAQADSTTTSTSM